MFTPSHNPLLSNIEGDLVMPQVHWLVPMGLYALIAYIFYPWILKKIVAKNRSKRLFLMFLFCAIFAFIFATMVGHLRFDRMTALIVGIGMLNGVACFARWKAVDVSLSEASLMSFPDDLIAMGLYALFFPIALIAINVLTGTGIMLCVGSAMLFAFYALQHKDESEALKKGKRSNPWSLFKCVAIYSVLWGICQFAEGASATEKLPVGQFLSSWYGGSLISATLLMFFYRDPDPEQHGAFTTQDAFGMFVFAAATVACLGIAYWVFSLVAQVVAQPIFLVGESIIPMLVGFVIFKEHKKFSRLQWTFCGLGTLGVILIGLGI